MLKFKHSTPHLPPIHPIHHALISRVRPLVQTLGILIEDYSDCPEDLASALASILKAQYVSQGDVLKVVFLPSPL